KSSASNTCRISISASSPGMGLGQRLTHWIASCNDAHFHNQKPATSSLVSANGPSITVRFSPANLTPAPFELACSPSPASSTPALISYSLNFPISARSSWLGRAPVSEIFVALTITMNRIFVSLCWFSGTFFHQLVVWRYLKSTTKLQLNPTLPIAVPGSVVLAPDVPA